LVPVCVKALAFYFGQFIGSGQLLISKSKKFKKQACIRLYYNMWLFINLRTQNLRQLLAGGCCYGVAECYTLIKSGTAKHFRQVVIIISSQIPSILINL
jgi:hypothetical protein